MHDRNEYHRFEGIGTPKPRIERPTIDAIKLFKRAAIIVAIATLLWFAWQTSPIHIFGDCSGTGNVPIHCTE